MLDEVTVLSIPLKQLLYHAPDLHKQCGKILGFADKQKLQGSKSIRKSRWNPGNMGLDQVHYVKVDTSTAEAAAMALQVVYTSVGDEILEFLIDSGAMASLVPSYYVVQKLNLTSNIMPSQSIVKFGDGTLELTQGSIKLHLVISPEVEVTHTFLVMKTCKTPLILGMDFLKLTGCRPDAAQECLEFTGAGVTKFVVNTFDGDGILKDPGFLPEEAVLEDPEALIVPVLLKQNAWNTKIHDVQLKEVVDFDPGETTMLPLKITKVAAEWDHNRALQPDSALWTLGLFAMPMVIHGSQVVDETTHSLAILNTSQRTITLEKGTLLGKLQ